MSGVQMIAPGMHAPCSVCEPELEPESQPERKSTHTWIFIPCSLELIEVCGYCGNTLREKRME